LAILLKKIFNLEKNWKAGNYFSTTYGTTKLVHSN
jgi:hypothetical protein